MPTHRATVKNTYYDPKQVLFELMLIDQNGYLSPDEIYQQEVNAMKKETVKKRTIKKPPAKGTVKKGKK